MDQTESLQTIAQMAIGLAGFTGIVSAVQHGAAAERSRLEAVRQLLETTLGVAFYAFFPVLSRNFVATDDAAWRWSNALLALAHAVTLGASLKRAGRGGAEGIVQYLKYAFTHAVAGKVGIFLHVTRVVGVL